MPYNRFRSAWKNRPDTSTPITAEALDHFEEGVKAAHDALDGRLSDATLNATYAPSSVAPDPALSRFHAALPAGTVRVLNIGHSITEGARAAAPGERWTDIALAKLRGTFQPAGVKGGFGYIPATATYPELLPSTWAFTGTAAASTNGTGLARYAMEMQSGSTASLTFTGTGLRLMHTTYSGGPTVTVSIDGVPAGNIAAASGTTNFAASTSYIGLTPGVHTITLSTPGLFVLEGALIYDGDDAAGIRSWNAGHAGDQIGTYLTGNPATRIPPVYTAIAPDLVTIQFGVNEYRNNTAVATFGTNLGALIDQVRTSVGSDVSILVLGDAEPLHAGTPTAPWSEYAAKAAEVAAAKSVAYLDLGPLPGLGLNAAGMDADQVHPNTVGHRTIGNAVAAALTKNVAAAPAGDAKLSTVEAATTYVRRATAVRRSSQVILAALGDSITACDNGVNYEWTSTAYDTNCSWLTHAVIKSAGRIDYGGNFGVPGETSAQILARVNHVIAARPTHCTVLAGANDSNVTTIKTNIPKIVAALQAGGVTPVLCTLLPNRTLGDSAVQTKIRAANAWIWNYARANSLAVIDFYRVMVNPADGDYLPGYFQDAVHPNRPAYPLMADEVLRVLDPVNGTAAYRRADNSVLGSELIANGLFLNFTSGAPDGWNTVLSDANVTVAQATDATFAGGRALSLTNAGTASKNYLLQQVATAVGGNVYEFGCRIDLSQIGELESGHPQIEIARGDNTVIRRIRFRTNNAGSIRHRFTNPAGNTALKVGVRWQNTNANTSCVFKIGEVTLRDLTALGALSV